MKFFTPLLSILLLLSPTLQAQQPWSGVLSPNRAFDWRANPPGVVGGIPTNRTQCGSTIAPYGSSSSPASPSTINSAIAACGANQYVLLGAGNFYLSSGVTFANVNNVTLRGAGADQTFLYFYGKGGCGLSANICLSSNATDYQHVTNTANWTGTAEGGSGAYPAGASHIIIDNAANLAVGGQIYLDQIDDDGEVNTNGTAVTWMSGSPFNTTWSGSMVIGTTAYTISSCGSTTSCTLTSSAGSQTGATYSKDPGYSYVCAIENVCVGQGGGKGRGSGAPGSRQQFQIGQVTAISGSGPYTVTISPSLTQSTWRASQSPGAWWPNSSAIMHDNGVENLTSDSTNSANCATCANIVIFNARNIWVKGVRSVEPNTNGGNPLSAHVWLYFALNSTVRDSYFYGSDNSSQSYGLEHDMDTSVLMENNIFQHVTAPIVGQGSGTADVSGYNFSLDDNYTAAGSAPGWMDPTNTWHEVGEAMNLDESNSGLGLDADNIHGTHQFGTFFRNHYYGDIWNNPSKNGNTQIMQLQAYSRMFNFVGNVLGASGGYLNTYNAHSATAVYDLTGAPYGGAPYGADKQTGATALRWANYDTVTGAVRFCGNSSDTGWSTVCGSTSEIPTGTAQFSNTAPTVGDTGAGQPALPNSFYLTGTPSWWVFPNGTTAPFPAIGPDVTGGSGPAGHSYAIPAENCWYKVMGGVVGKSGLLSFNANSCYGGGQAPASPVKLTGTGVAH